MGASVKLLAIRRCPKRKGWALACLSDRRFRAKSDRGVWGVACPERKGGAYACLVGRRWECNWWAGLALGEFFTFEGGEGGEEAEGGKGGFYLVEDFRSIGTHQVTVIAIREGHER